MLYLCATAEKMTAPFLLRVHGRSGHASMPAIADNALVKAAPLIERLASLSAEPRLIPEVEAFLAAICDGPRPPARHWRRAVDRLARRELIEPLLGTTMAPTMITRRRGAT